VRRALAEIDLGAVERNCARLRSALTGGARLAAVVKADGYGHGAIECARAALRGGAEVLAVAAASEAAEVREALPDATLFTMGALSAEELEDALAAGSELGVWREGFRGLVSDRGAAHGIRPRVHVKYDTGMGRLGERDPEAVFALCDAVAADARLELAGLWTHFATADEEDDSFLQEQLARFRDLADRVRERHPDVRLHAANSAATLREPAAHFDMVRCGIAIYGLDPFGRDPADNELEPALELRSYVADVKGFEAGATAGYGRTWRAAADTFVGVLPIGYGDGWRRGLSNASEALIDGRRYPLVGTVSMDNVTVDLGPEPAVEPGAEAVLIGARGGERILAEEIAGTLGTINYEVTCGISPRVTRAYTGGAAN
jgi:alanine racemase